MGSGEEVDFAFGGGVFEFFDPAFVLIFVSDGEGNLDDLLLCVLGLCYGVVGEFGMVNFGDGVFLLFLLLLRLIGCLRLIWAHNIL